MDGPFESACVSRLTIDLVVKIPPFLPFALRRLHLLRFELPWSLPATLAVMESRDNSYPFPPIVESLVVRSLP